MASKRINHAFVGETSVVSTSGDWSLEAGLVSWFGRKPRLDIRHWSSDHMEMSKGLRLSKEDAIRLRDTLMAMDIEGIDF